MKTNVCISIIVFLIVFMYVIIIKPNSIVLTAVTTPMASSLWRAIWACLVATVVTIIVSLITKPPPSEKLEGFTYGTVALATSDKTIWYKNVKVWAVISLIAFVIINLIFW